MARIAILATDGFEQSELVDPRRILKDAGHEVEVIAPKSGSIKGWKDGDWGEAVDVDIALADADATRYQALVLPGGVINPDKLRGEEKAIAFIRAMAAADKPVAAICHGPWLLVEAGLVKDKAATSYASIRTDMENAGAKWRDEAVVNDGGLITSRKPADIPAFTQAVIDAL